jgi:hypothetical protein
MQRSGKDVWVPWHHTITPQTSQQYTSQAALAAAARRVINRSAKAQNLLCPETHCCSSHMHDRIIIKHPACHLSHMQAAGHGTHVQHDIDARHTLPGATTNFDDMITMPSISIHSMIVFCQMAVHKQQQKQACTPASLTARRHAA